MKSVTIVDYKLNNLRSLENTLQRSGYAVEVTSDPERVRHAEKLILPGVGAFRDGMSNLRAHGLADVFVEKVRAGTPTLGVCLGLHLLFESSEEFGHHEGLGLLPGRIRRLPDSVRVPHMGWNQLHLKKPDILTEGVAQDSFVYFVHSYYPDTDPDLVIATTDYDIEFPCIIRRDNIWATQFHPEKSQHVGERLLNNFARS